MTTAPSSKSLKKVIRASMWGGPIGWARKTGVRLRPYQMEISEAIVNSVVRHEGRTFVVMLPRQSGKNELQTHLFAWLMFRYGRRGGRIVSVSPTFKPQTINAMDKVRSNLERSPMTRGQWSGSGGFVLKYRAARVQFFSADPSAKVVGATADLLLSVDEAQEVDIAKFDKDFDPMTASTNATRVFWGTAWTRNTLLHRQMERARQEEAEDGIRRAFLYDADEIRRFVPAYGEHVDRVVMEKGRQHPLVKTQYFCEEIDVQWKMFNEMRLGLMQGDQPGQEAPVMGHLYAFCIDVAGMDENSSVDNTLALPGSDRESTRSRGERDSTTLSIVEIDLSQYESLRAPIHRVVKRMNWRGWNHLDVFRNLCALESKWRPQHIVLDATGVGEGLWALLVKEFGEKVKPVKFTQQVKSEMGYAFLGLIETGRFRDCTSTEEVVTQYRHCESEILPGPQKTMRWGVKDGTRGADGSLVHDDFVMADALTTELDKMKWVPYMESVIIQAEDPIKWMNKNF